jgi:predicted permease
MPDPDLRRFTVLAQPIALGVSRMREQFAGALRLLMGGVVLLLLAVCANVAGLLLAKAGERRKEIGIRMAIGAGRWQVVTQLLEENAVLGVGGAVLGGALYWMAAGRVSGWLPPARDLAQYASPQLLTLTADWRVFVFAAAATVFVVLATGMVPAWRSARVDLLGEIKGSRRQWNHRRSGVVTVALQAAFTMALLAAAGLMLRTWWKLDRLDAGIDRAHLVSFTIDPASAGYKMQEVGAVATELRRRVDGLPGVRSTAWAWRALMRGSGIKTTVAPEGRVLPPSTFLNTSLQEVTPGYFDTMGMRLLEGRDLQRSDAGVEVMPVVVNQAFAAQFFPGQSAVGKRLAQGKDGTRRPNRVIVGVVNTAKYRSMREPDPPTMYAAWDVEKGTDWQFHLYVRTYGAPGSITGAVRRELNAIDPGVPLVEAATMESEIRASLWQERLVAALAAFFGAAAVALASIGLYAALALSVARQRREIGIRVAVGALRRHVAAAICGPMAAGVSCGVLAGVLGSAWLLRLTRGLLFGLEPFDPVSVGAAVGIVLASSALAAALPVRRAVRVDPATALRQDYP